MTPPWEQHAAELAHLDHAMAAIERRLGDGTK